ncbi:hypothetical protein EJB05_22151, partial [Eragrostis curvula]
MILVARPRRQQDNGRVGPAATKNRHSAVDGVPKPQPEPEDGGSARCSRNDGKRWRYQEVERSRAGVPVLRPPRPMKQSKKNKNSVIVEEEAEPRRTGTGATAPRDDDGFYKYYGGTWAGSMNQPMAVRSVLLLKLCSN